MLVTHPDHAHLAGEFASQWGNEMFAPPEPREHVLRGVYRHDDGWRGRDIQPAVTQQGKPAAFSAELVGAYSAFEEIDLAAYLAVRREAVQLIAQEDAYAAILISMHTHDLLSERADRSTIRPEQLPWLDAFLVEQMSLQRALLEQLQEAGTIAAEAFTAETFQRNFQLLQACDNLSLLSCVDFGGEATLLHPLALRNGGTSEVRVERTGERAFRLTPYPLASSKLVFGLKARFVEGKRFADAAQLKSLLDEAPFQQLDVTITA
ncbi:DUF3891 family protein [Granulicella sp. 5B5]|uniref:DUF3891 family protein n=1 Tax=Granulicella sp. 5B5 TaxID=1617967 RepID=UPI0015F5DAC9|nr:DUF3891 family protein [Granulicella sp. 5B5]